MLDIASQLTFDLPIISLQLNIHSKNCYFDTNQIGSVNRDIQKIFSKSAKA